MEDIFADDLTPHRGGETHSQRDLASMLGDIRDELRNAKKKKKRLKKKGMKSKKLKKATRKIKKLERQQKQIIVFLQTEERRKPAKSLRRGGV